MADAGALGLKRTLRAAERVSPREIVIGGRHLLDFSSNDYMALSMRPELIEGACEWTRRYGAGSAASRLVSGTTEACLELEAKIAKWKGFEAAMILSSGYAGNVGLIAALSGRSRTIFADKLRDVCFPAVISNVMPIAILNVWNRWSRGTGIKKS